jgi:Ribbon-helix-helix protein, copG family
MIGLRLPEKVTMQIDQWAEKNGVTRSEAIRCLIEQALLGSRSSQRSFKSRSKAHRLASEQIDKLIDPSAPDEEWQQRKRRLLKGPKEFREMRDKIRSKSKS